MISRLLQEETLEYLEIILYFTNKSEEILTDFTINFNPGACMSISFKYCWLILLLWKDITLEAEPTHMDSELLPGVQKTQRIILVFTEVPFEITLADVSYTK